MQVENIIPGAKRVNKKNWYLAELLEEYQAANDNTALLHVNWILVNADDAEEAYSKSLDFGKRLNQEYHNTEGILITVTFRGLRNLCEIYEEFADGSEIAYERFEDISRSEIERMIRSKEELAVFLPTDWDQIE